MQSEFNIKRQFQCDFSEALTCLGSLSAKRTPLEKLQCLSETSSCILKAIEAKLEHLGLHLGMEHVIRLTFLSSSLILNGLLAQERLSLELMI